MEGIKELREVIVAVNKLSCDVIKGLKDGVQFDDINIIIGNINVIKEALEGASNIPNEVKDLDLNEIKELVSLAIDAVKAILEAVNEKLPEAVVEASPAE